MQPALDADVVAQLESACETFDTGSTVIRSRLGWSRAGAEELARHARRVGLRVVEVPDGTGHCTCHVQHLPSALLSRRLAAGPVREAAESGREVPISIACPHDESWGLGLYVRAALGGGVSIVPVPRPPPTPTELPHLRAMLTNRCDGIVAAGVLRIIGECNARDALSVTEVALPASWGEEALRVVEDAVVCGGEWTLDLGVQPSGGTQYYLRMTTHGIAARVAAVFDGRKTRRWLEFEVPAVLEDEIEDCIASDLQHTLRERDDAIFCEVTNEARVAREANEAARARGEARRLYDRLFPGSGGLPFGRSVRRARGGERVVLDHTLRAGYTPHDAPRTMQAAQEVAYAALQRYT